MNISFKFLIFNLLLLLGLVLGGGRVAWGQTWAEQSSGTTNTLYDVFFVNSTTGWAVGDYGTIIKTTNGGTTWTAQNSGYPASTLNDVFFVNENIGFACGYVNQQVLLKTTNGGTTWTSMNQPPTPNISAIHFFSENEGFAVGFSSGDGRGKIWKTTNSGTTWTEAQSYSSGVFSQVYFTNSTTGWVIGKRNDNSNGLILGTNDGGSFWLWQTVSNLPTPNGIHISGNNIFVVTNQGWVAYSTDSGSNFTSQEFLGFGHHHKVHIIDANNIVIAGVGKIIKSNNGGTSWTPETLTGATELYGIHFTDASNGWVVGRNGKIFKYSSSSGCTPINVSSVYPPNNHSTTHGSANFNIEWTSTPQTGVCALAEYELGIRLVNNGIEISNTTVSKGLGTTSLFTPNNTTAYPIEVYWRVRAKNQNGDWGSFSAESLITISPSNTVASPTFSVTSGTYSTPQLVSLNTTTTGATIYYTLDGSNPTTSSPIYSSPITISQTTILKAFAVRSGYTDSQVASANYTINSCTLPTVNPIFPADYYTVTTGDTPFNVEWAGAGGAGGCAIAEYDFKLYSTTGININLPKGLSTTTTFIPQNTTNAPILYSWQVRAKNQNGEWGNYSPIRNIKVLPNPTTQMPVAKITKVEPDVNYPNYLNIEFEVTDPQNSKLNSLTLYFGIYGNSTYYTGIKSYDYKALDNNNQPVVLPRANFQFIIDTQSSYFKDLFWGSNLYELQIVTIDEDNYTNTETKRSFTFSPMPSAGGGGNSPTQTNSLQATVSKSSVHLEWIPSQNADNYDIQRSTNGNDFTTIATVRNNNYSPDAKITYPDYTPSNSQEVTYRIVPKNSTTNTPASSYSTTVAKTTNNTQTHQDAIVMIQDSQGLVKVNSKGIYIEANGTKYSVGSKGRCEFAFPVGQSITVTPKSSDYDFEPISAVVLSGDVIKTFKAIPKQPQAPTTANPNPPIINIVSANELRLRTDLLAVTPKQPYALTAMIENISSSDWNGDLRVHLLDASGNYIRETPIIASVSNITIPKGQTKSITIPAHNPFGNDPVIPNIPMNINVTNYQLVVKSQRYSTLPVDLSGIIGVSNPKIFSSGGAVDAAKYLVYKICDKDVTNPVEEAMNKLDEAATLIDNFGYLVEPDEMAKSYINKNFDAYVDPNRTVLASDIIEHIKKETPLNKVDKYLKFCDFINTIKEIDKEKDEVKRGLKLMQVVLKYAPSNPYFKIVSGYLQVAESAKDAIDRIANNLMANLLYLTPDYFNQAGSLSIQVQKPSSWWQPNTYYKGQDAKKIATLISDVEIGYYKNNQFGGWEKLSKPAEPSSERIFFDGIPETIEEAQGYVLRITFGEGWGNNNKGKKIILPINKDFASKTGQHIIFTLESSSPSSAGSFIKDIKLVQK